MFRALFCILYVFLAAVTVLAPVSGRRRRPAANRAADAPRARRAGDSPARGSGRAPIHFPGWMEGPGCRGGPAWGGSWRHAVPPPGRGARVYRGRAPRSPNIQAFGRCGSLRLFLPVPGRRSTPLDIGGRLRNTPMTDLPLAGRPQPPRQATPSKEPRSVRGQGVTKTGPRMYWLAMCKSLFDAVGATTPHLALPGASALRKVQWRVQDHIRPVGSAARTGVQLAPE